MEGLNGLHLELRNAIKRADAVTATRLIESGADIHYRDKNGYTAAIDSAFAGIEKARVVLPIIELLIRHGVDLDAVSAYNESALSVMSRIARFDGVRLLLSAGADPHSLGWTPLIEAVAIGTIDDVRREALPTILEAADRWQRTAWLVALQAGDREKAQLLLDFGANPNPISERVRPPIFYAIDCGRADLVRWLLDRGQPVDAMAAGGETALYEAVGNDGAECIDVLVSAGANVNSGEEFGSVLAQAGSAGVVRRLLDAGADPVNLSHDGARALCRLDDSVAVLDRVMVEAFDRGHTRRFGVSNPERIVEPFWDAMIRCGVSAYTGRAAFVDDVNYNRFPTWSAQRYGQSTTELPDGRVIQIGGEHEDSYDADFCIYNDVFVHVPDGKIDIFGYPEDVFPPTDFHTATLIGKYIYVIGSLGYHGARRFSATPVYRLHVDSMCMERMTISGSAPGWIYKHRSDPINAATIRIRGGMLVHEGGQTPNTAEFELDLEAMQWR